MVKKFSRLIEDFQCQHCRQKVEGTGYTNHCPHCLYSRHVDENPGDRQSTCGGLMRPIDVEIKQSHYVLIHRCEECGAIKKNKSAANDSFSVILQLMEDKAKG